MDVVWEIVPSIRTGQFLSINSYKFSLREGNKYRCIDCYISARLINNELVFDATQQHNHPNHKKKIDQHKSMLLAKSALKNDPSMKAKSAYRFAMRAQPDLFKSVPSYNRVKSTLNKFKSRNLPKQPAVREQLQIDPPFSQTLDGEQFLQIDDGAENKIVVFFTGR